MKTWSKLFLIIAGIALGFSIREFFTPQVQGAKIITVASRGQNYQIATLAATVGEVLREQNFDLSVVQVLPTVEAPVQSGMVVEVTRSVNVVVRDGGEETGAVTAALTVGDFLRENQIGLAATDQITPPLWSFVGEGMEIVIDRIVDLEVMETKSVPFAVVRQNDANAYYGQEALIQSGRDGEREQKFLITYKNGVEIARKLLADRAVRAPQDEIRNFGTKIEIVERVEGRASWYAYRDCMCAAHPFYDKGRFVRVTATNSGKSVIVQINDRGPDQSIHPDRVIDLDAVVYRELAPLGSGTIAVKTELLR